MATSNKDIAAFNEEIVALLKEMKQSIQNHQNLLFSIQSLVLSIAADPAIDRKKIMERYDELLAVHKKNELPDLLSGFRRP